MPLTGHTRRWSVSYDQRWSLLKNAMQIYPQANNHTCLGFTGDSRYIAVEYNTILCIIRQRQIDNFVQTITHKIWILTLLCVVSKAKRKTAVAPLLTHWSHCSPDIWDKTTDVLSFALVQPWSPGVTSQLWTARPQGHSHSYSIWMESSSRKRPNRNACSGVVPCHSAGPSIIKM